MLEIISGGQTGVDRAALDSALKNGQACGGWCPDGRRAEDGRIDDIYPLTELPGGGYAERTLKNVQDSDGTVVIYFGMLGGGTEKTLYHCIEQQKAYLLIDAREVDSERAAVRILEFFRGLHGPALNFAGPRASGEARAYEYTLRAVNQFLRLYAGA